MHEIADALEEWGKYNEKVTNAAEWGTLEAKQIIRKAMTLLVDNLALLNECKNKYGCFYPLTQCFIAIEQAASWTKTTDLGDCRAWIRDFTERHLWGGEKRSLADECIRYANEVDRETEQDTKREQEGMIEPKPPLILQNALWILKYGRKHWKLILLVLSVILISCFFVLPKIELFSKNTPTNSENSRTIEFHSIPNTENLDVIKSLESMRMEISLSYVKSLFGIPIREHKLKSGRREILYAFKPYYLQIVTDMDDLVVFFAITLRDRMFRYKIPYISAKFILGEVTYSDFGEPEETYFNVGSKTAKYREKHYYGNPGYYLDFWPAFNDSGVNLIGASNNDLGDSKICVVRGEELHSLRKKLRPNTIGIASMGYDGLDGEIHEIDVGPCRLITRELE